MSFDVSVIVSLERSYPAHFLRSCIQSIFNQTYSVGEVIIVIPENLYLRYHIDFNKAYSNTTPVRWIVKKDNLNEPYKLIGVKNSKCKWIAFIDPDCTWLMDKIEDQIKLLHENISVISEGMVGLFSDEYSNFLYTVMDYYPFDLSRRESINGLLLNNASYAFSGLVLSRSKLIKISSEFDIYDDLTLLKKIIVNTKVVNTNRFHYIRKVCEDKVEEYQIERMKGEIQRIVERKKDILSLFGEGYWNEKICDMYSECVDLGITEYIETLYSSLCLKVKNSSLSVENLDYVRTIIYENELNDLMSFFEVHSSVAFYGAGHFGRVILSYIKEKSVFPVCFIVSHHDKAIKSIDGIRIEESSRENLKKFDGIVITMSLYDYPDMKEKLAYDFIGDIFTITPGTVRLAEMSNSRSGGI